MTRVAAVDCGTNTLRLLVADLDPATGTAREVLRESRIVRLGEGVDRTGRLSTAALTRAFAALDGFAALIAAHEAVAVRCCATSASRDASNADAFVDGVRARLGVPPEIVAGEEEAALTYAGATRGLEVPVPVLVVDVGGGSTELVLGRGHGLVDAACSLDVGSVRMTERHLHGDPPTADQVAAAVGDVDAAMDSAAAAGVDLARARTAVAVSGTGLTVAAATLHAAGSPVRDLGDVDGAELPVADVQAEVRRLLGRTVAERLTLPFLPPGRADVVAAGGLVLGRVLARTGLEALRVSVRDILDGIAWSLVAPALGRPARGRR